MFIPWILAIIVIALLLFMAWAIVVSIAFLAAMSAITFFVGFNIGLAFFESDPAAWLTGILLLIFVLAGYLKFVSGLENK